MSMKRLAILSAASNSSHYGSQNAGMSPTQGYPHTPGVNVMLGGAMLSGIILVVFVLCYCCHKNGRKAENNSPYYWRDPGLSLEVYTVEGQNCYITEEIPIYDLQQRFPQASAPPPPYEDVVQSKKDLTSLEDPCKTPSTDDTGLPTYEAAMKLEVACNGYV